MSRPCPAGGDAAAPPRGAAALDAMLEELKAKVAAPPAAPTTPQAPFRALEWQVEDLGRRHAQLQDVVASLARQVHDLLHRPEGAPHGELLRELQEERSIVADTLEGVKQEKCEVIALMHTFAEGKDAAMRDLQDFRQNVLCDLLELRVQQECAADAAAAGRPPAVVPGPTMTPQRGSLRLGAAFPSGPSLKLPVRQVSVPALHVTSAAVQSPPPRRTASPPRVANVAVAPLVPPHDLGEALATGCAEEPARRAQSPQRHSRCPGAHLGHQAAAPGATPVRRSAPAPGAPVPARPASAVRARPGSPVRGGASPQGLGLPQPGQVMQLVQQPQHQQLRQQSPPPLAHQSALSPRPELQRQPQQGEPQQHHQVAPSTMGPIPSTVSPLVSQRACDLWPLGSEVQHARASHGAAAFQEVQRAARLLIRQDSAVPKC